IDGQLLSSANIDKLNIAKNQFINFKIMVSANAQNKGGVTIFGKDFGNHPQDILVNLYYS
ncbi:MAG TPA: transcriptional regulator, partial [Candidatus Blautia faecigallinarum]|nr:transcriptional regulator [Candidatus Blautia faecigallinarum]